MCLYFEADYCNDGSEPSSFEVIVSYAARSIVRADVMCQSRCLCQSRPDFHDSPKNTLVVMFNCLDQLASGVASA